MSNGDRRSWCSKILIRCSAIVVNLLLVVQPKDVVRDDGRHIAIFTEPNIKKELAGVLSVLTDPKIIILLPAMFVGEMCLALTSSINGMRLLPHFDGIRG